MIRSAATTSIDPFLIAALACPRDRGDLDLAGDSLSCAQGHRYPVVRNIPVMLLDDVTQTLAVATDSMREAAHGAPPEVRSDSAAPAAVDPYVQSAIGGTGGYLYNQLQQTLREYPIPEMRLARASEPGEFLLDVGSNWGRWCIAAARLGYAAVGIDPSLEAIQAAVRVARQLGADARFVVGDARYLPFADSTFSAVFSYSVLQHFAKPDASRALGEAGRVLKPGGRSLIQMANVYGLRCLYHQMLRGSREPVDFEVRYWTPGELKSAASRAIGPTALSIDGFFSLNPQHSDLRILKPAHRLVVRASDTMRALSRFAPALLNVADSIYLDSKKAAD